MTFRNFTLAISIIICLILLSCVPVCKASSPIGYEGCYIKSDYEITGLKYEDKYDTLSDAERKTYKSISENNGAFKTFGGENSKMTIVVSKSFYSFRGGKPFNDL